MADFDLPVITRSDGGRSYVPVPVVAFNIDGTPATSGGGGTLPTEMTIGEVNVTATEMPNGTKAPVTLGVFGQQIVEVSLWQGDELPMATLKQPLTASEFAVTMGTPADAAWDGVAANATVISLLKALVLKPDTPA